MGDGALPHVGDDFNVCMGMEGESAAWRNLIVVPNKEIADGLVDWVAMRSDREMVQRFEPSEIAPTKFIAGPMLNHVMRSYVRGRLRVIEEVAREQRQP
jgi:hypothetical protein